MITQKRLLFVFLFFGAVFAGFAQEGGEWYQGKIIRDISFTGLNHVKMSDLEGLVNPYKGRVFNDSIFWEIQSALYGTEYFEQISPSAVPADALGSEVIIRFAVVERPIVSRINFVGNSGLRRNELLDTISLKINEVVNQAKIRVDEQAIINKSLEKGYPDIQVRSDTQTAAGSIALTFYVTEGEKISISEFRFEGNSAFSARTLRSQLSLKAKNLINDGAFQESKLLEDRESVTRYYHDRGYIEAVIIDVTRDIEKDAKGNNNLVLTFRIFEGKVFTFGGITFAGNSIFSTEQLDKLVTSKTGEIVNERRLESDIQRIMDLYYENGYIFNTIGREENKDANAAVISYHIPIVERGRAHIENIVVRGNTKTKTDVILREIPMEPGDVFSKTKIMDGMRNLYNLQYFSAVVPDTLTGSADSLMDLVVNVEEAPTTDLQLGLTFSGSADPDTFPVSALIKWNDRNFKGTGNQLGADLNASPDTVSAVLNYTHRWIFGLPLSGGFDFTGQWAKRLAPLQRTDMWFNGDEPYAFPEGPSTWDEYRSVGYDLPDEVLMPYNQWYLSLGFSTGYRWLTPLGNLSVGGGIRFGLVRSDYDTVYTPFDPALREGNNMWMPKNSTWYSVALDQRDIYYDPSRGYYAMDRFGIYGLFNQEREHYLRNDAKAEYFFTLFDIPVTEKWSFKSVLGLHTGLSFIIKQPGYEGASSWIEEANQLAIDGMFIGRGWSGEYRNKGNALWENWIELRFPLVPGVLAWDFFFDTATVETRKGFYFQDYSFDNMRFSFGGGIRFTIPQFPFRFSFAKRFNLKDGEFQWQQGAIGANGNPESGIDFVISFALSTY